MKSLTEITTWSSFIAPHDTALERTGERAVEWEYVRCSARYPAGKIQEGGFIPMTFSTFVISTDLALALARGVVGLVMSAHGAQKVLGAWGWSGFAGWPQCITCMGMRPSVLCVYLSVFAAPAGGFAFA